MKNLIAQNKKLSQLFAETSQNNVSNLLIGLLIGFIFQSIRYSGIETSYFGDLMKEHLTPKSMLTFLFFSYLIWGCQFLLAAIFEPRTSYSIVYKIAIFNSRFDNFIIALFCVSCGITYGQMLSNLIKGILYSDLKYAEFSNFLLIIILLLPLLTLVFRSEAGKLPSPNESRKRWNKDHLFRIFSRVCFSFLSFFSSIMTLAIIFKVFYKDV